MSYFKDSELEIVDSEGGVWKFKAFTPKVRNIVLRRMDACSVPVSGGDDAEDVGNDMIDAIELTENIVKYCYITAPEALCEEFEGRFNRKFTAEDIVECSVFDELAESIIGKPSKN